MNFEQEKNNIRLFIYNNMTFFLLNFQNLPWDETIVCFNVI